MLLRALGMLLVIGAQVTAGEFSVRASLPADELVRGNRYEIVIEIDMDGAINQWPPWKNAALPDGQMRPILQLDVPDCVRLQGRAPRKLVTPRDYQDAYLERPLGRFISQKETSIGFKLTENPTADDAVILNVVAYLTGDSPTDARFIRKRLMLPIEAGAVATEVSADVSTWGKGDTLAIGDKAETFALPTHDGSTVSLADYFGKSNVLVQAYRGDT